MEDNSSDHPYVPEDLILPGFVPNFYPAQTILLIFAAALLFLFFISWWIIPGLFSTKKLEKLEKWLIFWFTLSGIIHIVVEGYFVFTPDFIKDNTGFYLAEVWKEYSRGDSRYVSFDSAVVAIEGATAVAFGPACLLAVYAIATQKSYSNVLQLVISLGQFYGLVIYFVTAILEGDNFSINPLYYYGYYIFLNSFWGYIPFLIMVRCWRKICESEGRNKTKIQ